MALTPLLKPFEKGDQVSDLVRLEAELRHGWMAGRNPFGKCLFEAFDRVALVKVAERRRH
jgi:hypothetical protein